MKPDRYLSNPGALAIGGLAMLLSACLSGGEDGDDGKGKGILTEAALGETGLAGELGMVCFLFEYGDGATLDSAQLRVRGRMSIRPDSGRAGPRAYQTAS
jgi:hypothetical protein